MLKIFMKYQDLIIHLLSDPFGKKIVNEDDDGRAGNEPKRVEAEKRIIETALRQKQVYSINFLRSSTFSG